MASNTEIRMMLKTSLYDLLKLKKASAQKEDMLNDLDELIKRAKTAMEQEDVAWVEKMLNE